MWEELHTLGIARFCSIRNGTISFIIQNMQYWGLVKNMFGSNERAKVGYYPLLPLDCTSIEASLKLMHCLLYIVYGYPLK